MSAGPWQPRALTCEASTAGVASVISAVETLPVAQPFFATCSKIVGSVRSVFAVVEMRPLEVL